MIRKVRNMCGWIGRRQGGDGKQRNCTLYIFFKSQKKRDSEECNQKFYKLWKAWKDPFPGMKFNKFYGLFCTTRNYIHKYHMAGRISEESNEAFNAVLANVKRMMRSMPATVGRINKINQQTQVKLKSTVAQPGNIILDATTGKKRAPYGKRQITDGSAKLVTSIVKTVMYDDEAYFELANGTLLPERWRDFYEWYVDKKAPSAWTNAILDTAPLNITASERAKVDHCSR